MFDFTVVTVVFNAIEAGRKAALLRCLESVAAQKKVSVEHIIVDGASSDGTLELLRTFEKGVQSKRRGDCEYSFRVLSEKDKGIYDAMNKGICAARGTYTLFLNSDDRYCDDRGLKVTFDKLRETKADFSFAPIRVVDEKTGRRVSHINECPDVTRIFAQMSFSHQSMAVRTELLRDLGGFDLAYRSSSDYDLLLRMIFAGAKACYVDCRFVVFRMGGFSIENGELSRREVAKIYSTLYRREMGLEIDEDEAYHYYCFQKLPREFKKRLYSYYQHCFRNCPQDRGCAISIRTLLRTRAFGSAILVGINSLRAKFNSSVETLEVAPNEFWQIDGVYHDEYWGVWGGREIKIHLELPESFVGANLVFFAAVGGYIDKIGATRKITVYLNGECAWSGNVKHGFPRVYRFEGASLTRQLEIRIVTDRTFIPQELGHSDDPRELGVSFGGFRIRKG